MDPLSNGQIILRVKTDSYDRNLRKAITAEEELLGVHSDPRKLGTFDDHPSAYSSSAGQSCVAKAADSDPFVEDFYMTETKLGNKKDSSTLDHAND